MKLRGVTEKAGRLYGRVHVKGGGEISFPLPNEKTRQVFHSIRGLIRSALLKGFTRDDIVAALKDDTLRDIVTAPQEEVPTSSTLAEVARRWLAEYVGQNYVAKNEHGSMLRDKEGKPILTRPGEMIRARVEGWLIPFLGVKRIDEVDEADAFAYKGHLLSGHPGIRKPQTLVHYLRDMRAMLRWAKAVKVLGSCPWPETGIMPKLPRKKKPNRLSDEAVAVLWFIPGVHGFVVRLLLTAGLRWGEACRSTRRDIRDGHLAIGKSKSGEAREVPLSGPIIAEVRRQGRDRLVPFSERCSGSFNKTVRRLALKRLDTRPQEVRDNQALREELAKFHAHQCRHTFGCRYIEDGGELAMLSKILGHTSIEMTQRYAAADRKAVRRDADLVFARWEERAG